MLLELSVEDNLIMENHRQFCSGKLLKHKLVAEYADRVIEEFGVKTPNRMVQAQTLSGGNLQKLVLACELCSPVNMMVAAQPTRGLDVGAIEYIHNQLVAQRDAGKAVLLVSLELEEVMSVPDRILVIYNGGITGEFKGGKVTEEELGLYMAGAKHMNKEAQ